MVSRRFLIIFSLCVFVVWVLNMSTVPCPPCVCSGEVTPVYIQKPRLTIDQPMECRYSREIQGVWNIEAFVSCASETPDPRDVSILVQMTIDRFDTLLALATGWKGPMTVMLYLPQNEYSLSDVKKRHKEHEILAKYADFHILYQEESRYPVNILRNLAMQYARTSYFVTLDVDFIPNPDMHAQLKAVTSMRTHLSRKEVLVIPAFEVPSGKYPNTKEAMRKMYKANTTYQVHYYKGIHAHYPTNYEKWYETDEPYEVKYEYSYEPYFVVKREECPLYDERFIGYGNDKSSHAYELAVAGFNFVVVPDSFIIHKDHPSPAWRSDQGSAEAWLRWSDFTRDMKWKYGTSFPVPPWLRDACNNGDCPQFWLWG